MCWNSENAEKFIEKGQSSEINPTPLPYFARNITFDSHSSASPKCLIFKPNCTYLFGTLRRLIMGVEFGRAKIPMARPNEPDMPPKRSKKVRLGIYCTQTQPKIFDKIAWHFLTLLFGVSFSKFSKSKFSE